MIESARVERLIKAREYQKKAIRALLPDYMQDHVAVIEDELKAMVKEGVFELLQSEQGMEFMKSMMAVGNAFNESSTNESSTNESSTDKCSDEESEKKDSTSDGAGTKKSNTASKHSKTVSRAKKVTIS